MSAANPPTTVPLSYIVPPFPSLYWPFQARPSDPQYLYYLTDIWRFTLYWTLLTVVSAHFLASLSSVAMLLVSAARQARLVKSLRASLVELRKEHDGDEAEEEEDQMLEGGGLGLGTGSRRPETRHTAHSAAFDPLGLGMGIGLEGMQRSETKATAKTKSSHKHAKSNSDPLFTHRPTSSHRQNHLKHHSSLHPQHRPADQITPAHLSKSLSLLGSTPFRSTLTYAPFIPLFYCVVGGLEALLAGSLVGLILGAVYNAGYFRMSTWTPMLWGVINMLVLVVGSFRIQGGL